MKELLVYLKQGDFNTGDWLPSDGIVQKTGRGCGDPETSSSVEPPPYLGGGAEKTCVTGALTRVTSRGAGGDASAPKRLLPHPLCPTAPVVPLATPQQGQPAAGQPALTGVFSSVSS